MSECGTGCGSQGIGVYADVKDYYGKQLKKTSDLKSNACVSPAKPTPAFIRKALKEVHSEVTSRYYGCGLVVPECLEGCRVLDLGSGSGQDCYVLSQLVGEEGHITGLDMTEEQLEVAEKYIDYHMKKFGYMHPNVDFVKGYIEALQDAGLKENTYDVIISNCVINLSPNKSAVLREAYRVLKDGGELYFSDVYSNKRLPEEVRTHKVLWGECLGGALWWKDLLLLAEEVGFGTPRLVTAHYITIGNKELESLIGDCKFVSATYRLFKIPKSCPRERRQVIYNGAITGFEKMLEFDVNCTFQEGQVAEVDGEIAAILKGSRFAEEFSFQPVVKTQPASTGCCPAVSQTIVTDPFEIADLLEHGNTRLPTGGCCGAKALDCQ
ncbi:arsenite methyltransferase isoform X2 [Lepisosteus oculatus]|uniref:arsenite methyltransferase isoform X2 n=1 Tax=Lepisosteus oculatus TaxID=7918 RepID=UPI003712FA0B